MKYKDNGMKCFFVFLTFFSLTCVAGKGKIMHLTEADTSFTLASEFKKQAKYFPQIKIAIPDTSHLTVFRDVVYTKYGKREMHLDLFFPYSERYNQLPVVIFIHGGGWRSGDRSMDWPMATELARKGFLTVCVEYRLSGEVLYPAGIVDVKTAIRWLRSNFKRFPIDMGRFALAGTSSGGQMAALIGTINGTVPVYKVKSHRNVSDQVQAVIDIDGVLAFIHTESGEGADKPGKPSAATLWFGASQVEKPELWNEASALTHVNPLSAPVLFINSALPRFHAGRDDYIKKLDSLLIYNEVHTIENTPHTFWLFHPWFEQTILFMHQFLKKQL